MSYLTIFGAVLIFLGLIMTYLGRKESEKDRRIQLELRNQRTEIDLLNATPNPNVMFMADWWLEHRRALKFYNKKGELVRWEVLGEVDLTEKP